MLTTMDSRKSSKYFFPKTDPTRRPPVWWYVAWVVYANRHTFLRAFVLFAVATAVVFAVGVILETSLLLWMAAIIALLGLFLLVNSIVGLTLVYGPPSRNYIKQLLDLGGNTDAATIADLHIGTYRISYILADLVSAAQIESVDIWDEGRYETERALVLLRALESVPTAEPRLRTHAGIGEAVPLPDASCEIVVLGLGLHEIPEGPPREAIFGEAKRILKPGGVCLFFEHTVDLQSLLVFGTGMYHWVRREEWLDLLKRVFGSEVRHQRSWQAVDLFAVRKTD
jgi:SAM-dependent methyltransferase